MSDLTDRYRYQYRMFYQFGSWKHFYELIGRHGAVHFHVTDFGENRKGFPDRYSAGFEVHYREPPNYMRSLPPSHDHCPLLKTPCWHDGTSLYAQETLLPMFLRMNHIAMFRFLIGDADNRFGLTSDDTQPEFIE